MNNTRADKINITKNCIVIIAAFIIISFICPFIFTSPLVPGDSHIANVGNIVSLILDIILLIVGWTIVLCDSISDNVPVDWLFGISNIYSILDGVWNISKSLKAIGIAAIILIVIGFIIFLCSIDLAKIVEKHEEKIKHKLYVLEKDEEHE